MNNNFNFGFLSRLAMGIRAFREAYVAQNILNSLDFENYEARKVRYDMFQSFYDNTTYRDNVHTWSQQYRASYQLYKAIRSIYNPTYRCVEFWKWMVWGGILDGEAKETGAIPIKTDHQNLRPAIAKIWKWSNWGANKDLIPQWGAAMGDVAIRIVDDVAKSEVRLEVVHPKTLKNLDLDGNGFVKGYTIQETRWVDGKKVTYEEDCTHKQGSMDVNFATYKDGKLFAWNEVAAEWSEPYGFVPLIAIQHIRTGMAYGWSEIYTSRVKIHELDDIASKLHDYIRKVIDPVWLFNFKRPKEGIDLRQAGSSPTVSNPQPIREELPAIYVGDPAAKAQALVANEVDIAKTAGEVQNIIAELERDLPELQMDIWTAGQYTTGKALRNARQRVERKVIQRRPEYDTALVRAHQMAIAIAGMRQYEDFKDFSLESYDKGELDHTIPSGRPIFDTDATETTDQKKVFWDVIVEADRQGLPLDEVLKDMGKSDDWVTRFMAAREKEKADRAKRAAELTANNPGQTNGNNPVVGGNNQPAPSGVDAGKPSDVSSTPQTTAAQGAA